MISLDKRSYEPELMDDFSMGEQSLQDALEEIRWVNRLLGGYATTLRTLGAYVLRHKDRPLHILDLGTGLADYPVRLLRWADANGLSMRITAVDANPETVAFAQDHLALKLPKSRRDAVRVMEGDALNLPFEDDAFDISTAAMFLHHLDDQDAVSLLTEMRRLSREGLVINDLHRHVLAYYGILLPTKLLPVSDHFRHDAPLSVRRAFRRQDLVSLAEAAGLTDFHIRWHWAFRWSLSTLPSHQPTP